MSDAVAGYIAGLFAPEDDVLRALREDAERAGLPPISVPPETGRFLQVMLRAIGARRLVRPGGLIIADNALRRGDVLDASITDADIRGVREFKRRLATTPGITGIIAPIGDGVAVGVVGE